MTKKAASQLPAIARSMELTANVAGIYRNFSEIEVSDEDYNAMFRVIQHATYKALESDSEEAGDALCLFEDSVRSLIDCHDDPWRQTQMNIFFKLAGFDG